MEHKNKDIKINDSSLMDIKLKLSTLPKAFSAAAWNFLCCFVQ
jgi:hypothetical protein